MCVPINAGIWCSSCWFPGISTKHHCFGRRKSGQLATTEGQQVEQSHPRMAWCPFPQPVGWGTLMRPRSCSPWGRLTYVATPGARPWGPAESLRRSLVRARRWNGAAFRGRWRGPPGQQMAYIIVPGRPVKDPRSSMNHDVSK